MVTKALVLDASNPSSIGIRVPVLDNIETYATISSMPNCELNLSPGDIVYIAFEDNSIDTPVIIGSLNSVENDFIRSASLKLLSIDVEQKANLPLNTSIGDVDSDKIQFLKNVTSDIQKQIDSISNSNQTQSGDLSSNADSLKLSAEVVEIKKQIDNLNNKIKNLDTDIDSLKYDIVDSLPTNPTRGQLVFLIQD